MLQIPGIPSSTEDSSLEDTVRRQLRKVKLLIIDLSNVEDCHRLKSNNNASQKVIIKLSKRKEVNRVLKSKSSYKNVDVTENGIPLNTNIFVNPSLCRCYKFLWSKCKKLSLNEVIESFWESKDSCWIRLIHNSIKIIAHFEDLFPGHAVLEKMLIVRNYSGRLYLFCARIQLFCVLLRAAVVKRLAFLKIRQS